MREIIPLHRSNVIGINASSGDWLNALRMRLRTIWESPCNYTMGEHYRWWWERHLKKGFSSSWMEKVSIQRNGVRSEGLHDAFTVWGEKGGGIDLFCKLKAWLLVVRRRWFSVQLTINPIKVVLDSRFKRASFDSGFSTIEL